jgi:hypothetical protein
MKRGDLVFIQDPVRPTGAGTGFRGLALVDEPGEAEVKVRPLDKTHTYVVSLCPQSTSFTRRHSSPQRRSF